MAYIHKGMRRALLTGYEPWGGMNSNPTMDIVGLYRDRNIGKIEVATDILPTAFRDAEERVRELIDRYGPDIVLELGLGGRRRKLKLEERARNVRYADVADNNGYRPRGGLILRRGPDVYHTTMDMGGLKERLDDEGIPARLSTDAGQYVCNSTYYSTLDAIQRARMDTKAGLIHMPWTTRYPREVRKGAGWPMEEQDVAKAVRIALQRA